mmetsp:Transcript_5399/g.9073  ORF Transcript_5399/g.9073 Transcript_5399/m.9073 type:complete len:209 (+) Transcript_5399:96-722(+)
MGRGGFFGLDAGSQLAEGAQKPKQTLGRGEEERKRRGSKAKRPSKQSQGDDLAGLISEAFTSKTGREQAKAGSANFEAMSRKSTANSNFAAHSEAEHQKEFAQSTGLPSGKSGSSKAEGLQRRESGKYRQSSQARQLNNSNTEKSIMQEASEEAITLSLDPKAAKKRKQIPRHLLPLDNSKAAKSSIGKFNGNYAAEVLKELERREKG